jgi:hypothetical protein
MQLDSCRDKFDLPIDVKEVSAVLSLPRCATMA